MTPRRLIVTADDVGLHEAMTRGAIEAHRQGIVTACSVVATGRAFEHAVDALRRVATLETGVHLTLSGERTLLPPNSVPSLVDARGMMRRGHVSFTAAWLAGRVSLDDVEREFRAQIERLLGAGVAVTHLDGHQHLHLLPGIFSLVQRLAFAYRVPYIRIVDDRGGTLSPARRLPIAMLNALGRRARRRAAIVTNRNTIGVADAGHLDARRLTRLFRHVGAATELVTHPAVADDDLAVRYRWKYAWAGELEALCSPAVRAAISAEGIRLIRPSDYSREAR